MADPVMDAAVRELLDRMRTQQAAGGLPPDTGHLRADAAFVPAGSASPVPKAPPAAGSRGPAAAAAAAAAHADPHDEYGRGASSADPVEEIRHLRQQLRATRDALEAERLRHAETKELLRLALRPKGAGGGRVDAVDGAGVGATAGLEDGGRHGSAAAAAGAPQFVRDAQHQYMVLSPRVHASASTTVQELFYRVTQSPGRARGGGGGGFPQQPRRATSRSPTASHRGGTPARSRAGGPAAPVAFGARSPRFKGMDLVGDHALFATPNARALSYEMTPDERRAVLRKARENIATPGRERATSPRDRTAGGGGVGASPLVTGLVRAPESSNRLRSPDIARWVQSLEPSRLPAS